MLELARDRPEVEEFLGDVQTLRIDDADHCRVVGALRLAQPSKSILPGDRASEFAGDFERIDLVCVKICQLLSLHVHGELLWLLLPHRSV